MHFPSIPGLSLLCFFCASVSPLLDSSMLRLPPALSAHLAPKAVSTRERYLLSPNSLRDVAQASYFMNGEMNGESRGSLDPRSKRLKDGPSALLVQSPFLLQRSCAVGEITD